MSLHQAQSQIERIATAIAQGDLEAADSALRDLRPMLVSDRIDELQDLKARIDAMTLVVRKQREDVGAELKNISSQRKAVEQYQVMGDLPLH